MNWLSVSDRSTESAKHSWSKYADDACVGDGAVEDSAVSD